MELDAEGKDIKIKTQLLETISYTIDFLDEVEGVANWLAGLLNECPELSTELADLAKTATKIQETARRYHRGISLREYREREIQNDSDGPEAQKDCAGGARPQKR